jgi:hypothetical protein
MTVKRTVFLVICIAYVKRQNRFEHKTGCAVRSQKDLTMRLLAAITVLLFVTGPSLAQKSDGARLKELEASTQPPQQTDLDTFKIASAHRERAESMREKTNGLWQSWLVSICEGCGPERQPYFKRSPTQVSEKAAPKPTVVQNKSNDTPKIAAIQPQKRSLIVTVASDLSDSSIDQIRRAPSQ